MRAGWDGAGEVLCSDIVICGSGGRRFGTVTGIPHQPRCNTNYNGRLRISYPIASRRRYDSEKAYRLGYNYT